MNVLIDATRYVIENAGIARYTKNIIQALAKEYPDDNYSFLVTCARLDANKKQKIKWLERFGKVKYYRLPGQWKEYLWEKHWAKLYFSFWFKGYDILLAPSFFELPVFNSLPSALVIYDLTTARFPKQRGQKLSQRLTKLTCSAAQRAGINLAISRQTKSDLIKYCHIDPKSTTVTLLAAEPIFKPKTPKREKFILTVGTLEPRKNLITIIKAYNQLPQKLQLEYSLKIVGAKGWNDLEIQAIIAQNANNKQIKTIGHINDEQLVKLYNTASLFVYIPFFEGFGLPVVEAMACGTPVITSQVSSLPEVGGNASVYLKDPSDVAGLKSLINKLLSNPNRLKVLEKKSLAQARKFSWSQTARNTHKVMESILSG